MSAGWEAIDLRVLAFINREAVHPWLDVFFVWLTDPPFREIYFAVAALSLGILGRRRGLVAIVTIGLAILVTDQLIAEVLKPAFDRVRPVFAHPDEVRFLLAKQARSPSMPSAHAANAFAAAVVLFELRRSVGWGALVLAFLIAYSRPYVGVHYPSDMLVGAVLGSAVAVAAIGVRRLLGRSLARRRSRGKPDAPVGKSPSAP